MNRKNNEVCKITTNTLGKYVYFIRVLLFNLESEEPFDPNTEGTNRSQDFQVVFFLEVFQTKFCMNFVFLNMLLVLPCEYS
jgi:hypothetical protein